MIYGTLHIHITTFLLIHGIVVLHYFLHLHLPMHYGTRVDGFRTVRIHLQHGVCLRRYSQVDGIFATLPVLYKYTGATTGMELSHFTLEQMNAAGAYPVAQGVMSILAVVANVICIAVIIKRAIEQKKNPYKNEIFAGTKDFEEAMDRA